MKSLFKIFLGIWLSVFFVAGAFAVQRHALVVGNGEYKNSPLKNPTNDAADIAVVLRQVGFSVRHLENASRGQLRRALLNFKGDLSDGGVGLFYYSGHGIQLKGENYLIPIGANIQSEFEIEDEAIGLRRVLGAMEESDSDLNIVILDACRSNPFKSFFRSGNRGFAIVQAPKGSLIAFATAPGQWAADGDGRNSPYTKYLLEMMKIPNLAIEHVFKRVRIEVNRETAGAQIPWEESSLMGDFFFSKESPSVVEKPAVVEKPKVPEKEQDINVVNLGEQELYDKAFNMLKLSRYEEAADEFANFLRQYRNSALTDDAWYWMAEALYVTRDFERARIAFNTVISYFGNSPRIPASRLKIGYIQYETADYEGSRETLTQLLRDFPAHRVAVSAEARLKKMDRQER
jgi:tol-pal system protein YbgF